MTSPVFSSFTATPVPIPKGISIKYEHHFFIQADITIQDHKHGTRVRIGFASQHNGRHQVEVLPKVFTKWQTTHPTHTSIELTGSWRATLYGKTFKDQRLGHLQLARMVSLENAVDLDGADTFWSAAGKVLRLDRAEKLVLLRIYPQSKKTEPFVVSARTTLELLNLVEDATYLQMTGVLEHGYLIAQNLLPMRLDIPDHWKKWIPPKKRKVILENPSSNDDALESVGGDRE